MTNEKDKEEAINLAHNYGLYAEPITVARLTKDVARIRSEAYKEGYLDGCSVDGTQTERDKAAIAEAVKAERERCEAIVTEEILEYDCDFTDLVNNIVSRILSDDQEAAVCTWRFEGYLWAASCGATWEFPEGSPEDNNFRYCPHCGKPVKEEGRG